MSTASSVPLESKASKKRKGKPEAPAAAVVSGRDSPNADSVVNGSGDAVNGIYDSPYLKELTKSIRNLSKKLTASSKADAIIEQNPGVSVDELVAQKKLNADQKAQIVKKPQLQAQLAQLEEQQKGYQSLAQELAEGYAKEKATLIETHNAALQQAKEEAAALQAATSQVGDLDQSLKVLTGFLHAAAAKRQSDDADSEEARAFEGALLLVYQGNSSSLSTLKNLVEGSEDRVPDTEGTLLNYTFSQVKIAALQDVATISDENTASAEGVVGEADDNLGTEPTSDPTIANAGLTELEDTNTIAAESRTTIDAQPLTIPEQASVTAEAANAVAEANWDAQASIISTQTPTGEDWVQVPRDPAETETGSAQPAIQQSTANWADEAGDAAAEQKAAAVENDGFEQVRRDRDRGGRGRGPRGRGFDGRGRGRGRVDGYRGRGGQGRGRGGPRGGGGGGGGERTPQSS